MKHFDVRIDDHGDVTLFYPMSPAGREWARESLAGFEFGHGYTVQPWFAQDVLIGALSHGLTVGSAVAVDAANGAP